MRKYQDIGLDGLSARIWIRMEFPMSNLFFHT
jgi:hypothetical protein